MGRKTSWSIDFRDWLNNVLTSPTVTPEERKRSLIAWEASSTRGKGVAIYVRRRMIPSVAPISWVLLV